MSNTISIGEKESKKALNIFEQAVADFDHNKAILAIPDYKKTEQFVFSLTIMYNTLVNCSFASACWPALSKSLVRSNSL